MRSVKTLLPVGCYSVKKMKKRKPASLVLQEVAVAALAALVAGAAVAVAATMTVLLMPVSMRQRLLRRIIRDAATRTELPGRTEQTEQTEQTAWAVQWMAAEKAVLLVLDSGSGSGSGSAVESGLGFRRTEAPEWG